jgi:hypothetical protein
MTLARLKRRLWTLRHTSETCFLVLAHQEPSKGTKILARPCHQQAALLVRLPVHVTVLPSCSSTRISITTTTGTVTNGQFDQRRAHFKFPKPAALVDYLDSIDSGVRPSRMRVLLWAHSSHLKASLCHDKTTGQMVLGAHDAAAVTRKGRGTIPSSVPRLSQWNHQIVQIMSRRVSVRSTCLVLRLTLG